MRYPEFLKKGGCIGFAAPSFGCASEPYRTGFDKALDRFKAMGYSVKEGPNTRASEGTGISNTPEKCACELNELYQDEECDALISCGGGELMCEILPFVDFDGLGESRGKWYLGYSDNTNFTFLSNILMDTASIYGPCAPSFGMDSWHPALQDAFDLLTGEKLSFEGYEMWEKESLKNENDPTPPYNLTERSVVKAFLGAEPAKEVSFGGRITGGCLDCLANLVGTNFDRVAEFNARYSGDGILWFLEACDLNVFSMRRALWNLDRAGWFEGASGFIIGRPLHFGEDMMGLDQYSAVLGILGKYNLPVIMDADVGHLPPSVPILSGAIAHASVSEGTWKIGYELG